MERLKTEKYSKLLTKAVKRFWTTRDSQLTGKKKSDQGNRSSVTGGKQLDGFIDILVEASKDLGVPDDAGKALLGNLTYLDK